MDDVDDTTWSSEREVVLERVQNKSFGISIVGGKVSQWKLYFFLYFEEINVAEWFWNGKKLLIEKNCERFRCFVRSVFVYWFWGEINEVFSRWNFEVFSGKARHFRGKEAKKLLWNNLWHFFTKNPSKLNEFFVTDEDLSTNLRLVSCLH